MPGIDQIEESGGFEVGLFDPFNNALRVCSRPVLVSMPACSNALSMIPSFIISRNIQTGVYL